MNINYKFSKEASEALAHFLEVANKSKPSQDSTLWHHILPRNPNLEDSILSNIHNNDDIEIISISDDSMNNEDEHQEIENPIEIRNDVSDIWKQILVSDTQIGFSQEIMHQLIAQCKLNNNLFSNLESDINIETVSTLGKLLLDTTFFDKEVIKIFFQDVILIKLEKECNDQLVKLTDLYLNNQWHNIEAELTAYLLDNSSNALICNVQALMKKNKMYIFRNCVLKCNKLEEKHFELFLALFPDEIENDVLKKLVNDMEYVASNYSSDKMFGKLITSVVKIMDRSQKLVIEQLKHVAVEHKSVWKVQALKILTNYENNC